MRLLYLDDSGKLHPNDVSTFVTFGGFSVDEAQWHAVVRRITGAKKAFFPNRESGNPNEWEIKSTDFLKPKNLKKKVYQGFIAELARIMRSCDCHVYGVLIPKVKLKPPIVEEKYIPLAFQRLIAKFYAETQYYRTSGTVICDWSAYAMDEHIAKCVVSNVIASGMTDLVGGVSYASSHSLVPIQLADLISGVINRQAEGRADLDSTISLLKNLAFEQRHTLDIDGYPINSLFSLF